MPKLRNSCRLFRLIISCSLSSKTFIFNQIFAMWLQNYLIFPNTAIFFKYLFNTFAPLKNHTMHYIGELISIGVAFSWTATAWLGEIAGKRLGVFTLNVWRMLLTLLFSAILLYVLTGYPFPLYTNGITWFWLLLSGIVGYVLGDYCLFRSYLSIGSRYGQLFMTIAPMAAAFMAWFTLGQHLTVNSIIAMTVTLLGIAISVLGRGEGKKIALKLPLGGVLFGIGAGLGQGTGLVLSKIGLDYYMRDVPSDILPHIIHYLPFSANMIRCLTGLVAFIAIMWIHQGFGRFRESLHDGKGFGMMLIAVIFGPFLGVGFSLMAVQYTAAGIASTLMAITPILIIIPSHYLFGQPITFKGLFGAVISVLGVSLFFLL